MPSTHCSRKVSAGTSGREHSVRQLEQNGVARDVRQSQLLRDAGWRAHTLVDGFLGSMVSMPLARNGIQ